MKTLPVWIGWILALSMSALAAAQENPPAPRTPEQIAEDARKKEEEAARKREEEARKAREAEAERARQAKAALILAYQKEYAFLTAEEAALQGRLDDIAKERKTRVETSEKEARELEAKLADAQASLVKRRDKLREVEKKNASLEEDSFAVGAMITQALSSLERYAVAPAPEGRPAEERVEYVFGRAFDVLGKVRTIRTEEDSFFGPGGAEVKGKVLKLGDVASLSIGDAAKAPLAPAGGGRFKVWKTKSPLASTITEDVRQAGVLPIFIYEAREKAVDEEKVETVMEHMKAGGVVAYVIVVLGLITLAMLVIRTGILAVGAAQGRRLAEKVTPFLRRGQWKEALDLVGESGGPSGRVLRAALERPDADTERLESVLSEAMMKENLRLDRFEAFISVMTVVAPLLGLLGTVTGMITIFDVLTVHGTGDPRLLSGGIAEALIKTELGLFVAVPALLWGSVLTGWADRIRSGMETIALRILHLRGAGPEEEVSSADQADDEISSAVARR